MSWRDYPGRDVAEGWRLVTWDCFPPELRSEYVDVWITGHGMVWIESCEEGSTHISAPLAALKALIDQHEQFPKGIKT